MYSTLMDLSVYCSLFTIMCRSLGLKGTGCSRGTMNTDMFIRIEHLSLTRVHVLSVFHFTESVPIVLAVVTPDIRSDSLKTFRYSCCSASS